MSNILIFDSKSTEFRVVIEEADRGDSDLQPAYRLIAAVPKDFLITMKTWDKATPEFGFYEDLPERLNYVH